MPSLCLLTRPVLEVKWSGPITMPQSRVANQSEAVWPILRGPCSASDAHMLETIGRQGYSPTSLIQGVRASLVAAPIGRPDCRPNERYGGHLDEMCLWGAPLPTRRPHNFIEIFEIRK